MSDRLAAAGWWRDGVVYHVYPRSFADSDGDGVGDLRGIASRLDHLSWLGVDAAWLSPIFRSPMKDFGYDVSDHCDVEPVFGTLADADALIAAAHARGLKLLLDFVPNHTSDRHPWFREHPDWYFWADAPPNNWLSSFGGPGWTRDPERGRFYYHAYLREQPDVDWRNPELREAMLDVLRFWLDRGVDGFRVDALRQVVKDPELRDNPPNPDYREGQPQYDTLLSVNSADHDDLSPVVAIAETIAARGAVMVGELYTPLERLPRYHGAGVHMPSNMHLIATAWEPRALAELIERYEAVLPCDAWPNWVLGNHDRSRVATRVGAEQARVAAMLLLTLRGTPTLYYGDELGMPDVAIPPERAQDPWAEAGRDPERTPMQWSDGPGAGFTDGEPWLPFGDPSINVAAQREDPRSMLHLHRELIALRRAFVRKPYRTLAVDDARLVFARGDWTVALNLSGEPVERPAGEVRLSTRLDGGAGALRPHEGVVLSP
jgi:alpha-glucosidase